MQAGLTAADRNLLWAAGAVGFLLLAGTVVFAPSFSGQSSPVPSTYSSGSGGALAAYLLLVDLRYPVRRWEDPPAALTTPGRGSLLILAEPTESPSDKDRESLLHFVESGGRILFCGISAHEFFPDAHISSPTLDPEWKEFSSNLPTSLSRGADKIEMQPTVYWEQLNPSQFSLYGPQQSPVVVTWHMGAGEILWWAAATPLTNAGITRASNLRLFLNTVSLSQDGEPLSVYWDEYFHGERGSLWSYVQETPVVWGCLQLAIFMLALLFTFSRRSGPLVTPAVVSRLSPLEFVETMGGLYQRAKAASIPVDISYRRLRLELTRRLGLSSTTEDFALALAARDRLGFDDSLKDVLQDAALAAQVHRMSARRSLGLVQRLDAYASRLRSPNPIPMEPKSEEKN